MLLAVKPAGVTVRALVGSAAAVAAPLATLAAVAPWVHLEPLPSAMLALTVVSAAIVGAAWHVPARPLEARDVVVVVALGAALMGLAWRAPPVLGGLVGAVGLVAVASVLGGAVGGRMEAPGHLLAVALTSSAVDLWSVSSPSGPTHHVVQTPALLRLLTVGVAIPPERGPHPAVGFGDVVFVALYFAAASRFDLPRRRMAAALAASLVGAGALALWMDRPVPALPAMGVFVVATQPLARGIRAKDRRPTLLAALLLAASAIRAATR